MSAAPTRRAVRRPSTENWRSASVVAGARMSGMPKSMSTAKWTKKAIWRERGTFFMRLV